jgi:hypothetical protein
MALESVAGLLIAFAGLVLITASAPVLRYAERSVTATPQVSYGMIKWLARAMGVILFILGIMTWRMIAF